MHVCHRSVLISSPCQFGFCVHQSGRKKNKNKRRQISALTALNSLIAILLHAAGSRTAVAVELIDGKVAASLERPLNGRRRRTSVLELIINNDHLK